jgi:hypothetical protein
MLELNSIIAIYENQTEVNTGIRDLQQAGFDLRKLSILGKEHESGQQVIGYYSTGSRMKYWGPRGEFWNGSWKLLTGAGYFVIPDIGGVLVAGPVTAWIVAALKASINDGLSGVGAGLYAVSVPLASIVRYEAAVKMHKLLLIGYGSAQEVLKAKDVLHGSRPEEINVHFAEEGVNVAA